MKKILILSSTNTYGGAESVLCDYLKNNNEFDIYIVTNKVSLYKKELDKIMPKGHVIYSNWMQGLSFNKYPVKTMIYLIRNLFFIHSIVSKFKIDLLYGNNTMDMIYVTLYKCVMVNTISTVCHIHDIIDRSIYHKYISIFSKYVNVFIAPSNACADSFINYIDNKNKMNIIYNGLNMSTNSEIGLYNIKNIKNIKNIYGIPENKILLVFIGQLTALKRVDIFINILHELNKKRPHRYYGIIIGNNTDENIYSMVKSNECEYLSYLGKLDRDKLFNEIYPIIDALILTSDHDSLPTVILEAMAFGKMVIARNVDGVSEIIDNGKNGIIFEYNENINNIVSKIENIKDYNKYSDQSRNTVINNFTIEQKVMKINSILSCKY